MTIASKTTELVNAISAYTGNVHKRLVENKSVLATGEIDLSVAEYFTKTIAADTTFTVTNLPGALNVEPIVSFVLDLTNGGSYVVTWFAGITWFGGTPPVLSAAGRDIIAFYTFDNGATWNGFTLGSVDG